MPLPVLLKWRLPKTIIVFVFAGLMTALALALIYSQAALLAKPFFAMGSIFLIASFITPVVGTLVTLRGRQNTDKPIIKKVIAAHE